MKNEILRRNSLPDIEQQFSCEICLEFVPLSESKISEAEDYITFFCGLECYDLWIKQKTQSDI